ncbi:MAG: hypothetical protein KAS72_12160 [Phycisphaerales bacterium]|nr:hypothetical protein [Phycisphaerales bacterium]
MLVVLYGIQAIRVYTAKPNIAVNYVARIDAATLAIPESERAWPIYRSGLLLREAEPDWGGFNRRPRSGEQGWDAWASYLDANAEALALFRQAGAMPSMGLAISDMFSAENTQLWSPDRPDWNPNDEPLVMVPLKYLGWMRIASQVLAHDALRAAAEGDAATAAIDLRTIFAIGKHVRDHPFVFNDLVAFIIWERGLMALAEILASYPRALSDEMLRDLAHELAALGDGQGIRLRWQGERDTFHDLIQRTYTDDGHGDGFLSARGLLDFRMFLGSGKPGGSTDWIQHASIPAFSAVVVGRREIVEKHDRLISRWQAEACKPLWERRGDITDDKQWEELSGSPLWRVRNYLLVEFTPYLQRATVRPEIVTQRRDALQTAIALELYHRREGCWPESLDMLVPGLLPVIPRDRFDGKALKYRLVDGKPILYSVNADRDDDAGRPPTSPTGNILNDAGTWAPVMDQEDAWDGDWVLWPPIIDPLIADDEDD